MNRQPTSTRTLVFDIEARESDDAIPVVVSTESVVEVRDGPEMLMHTADAVDMSRAPLPIIATHSSGQINVGIVDGLRVEGGQLRGMARFGSRQQAMEYRNDVLARIIRAVSVGYARIRGTVRDDGVLVVSRWMPYHVAMVAEPADTGAGFYRSSEIPKFELESNTAAPVTRQQPAKAEGVITMAEANTAAAVAGAESQPSQQSGGDLERLRIKALQNLGRNHNIPSDTVEGWIDGGKTADEAAHETLQIIAAQKAREVTKNPAHLGMTQTDMQRYSITRAIRACVEKSWPKVAPFEAEMSKAVEQRIGKQGGEHTFFVPLDVQWQRQQMMRDLTVAANTGGGYLVGTNVQSFIELLRNRSVVMRLGATTMPGLVGSVAIPKQTGAATAYWFASEAGTATESNLTFGQLALSPKTVAGYVELSRQLLLQSTPNAETIVNSDLAKVIGLAVDAAALTGPGTAGQPTGIVNTSGVGTANPTAGTNVGYADLIKFQTTVANSNAFLPGFAYVTTPTVAGILMGKPRFTNSDTPVWDGTIMDGRAVGAPAMSSLQVGSGSMLAGDFSQVVIGEWGVLEIETNPYAQFQAGIVGVRAIYSIDVGVRYGAAFALGTGMTG